MKQIHEVLRVGFEPGTHGLEVQHPNHLATLPPSVLHYNLLYLSILPGGVRQKAPRLYFLYLDLILHCEKL